MAFDVRDYLELLRLLQEHPEWRAELRRLLLTDELLALPEIVRELVEAQRRTEEQIAVLVEAQRRTEERVGGVEERVGRVEEQIAALAEAQRRTEERVGYIEEQVAALAEAQRQMQEQIRQLTSSIALLAEQVRSLVEAQKHLDATVGGLKGRMLELMYQSKAVAYFGPLLRRPRVVDLSALLEVLEAHLSPEEFHDVLQLDLLVSGRPRLQPEAPEVFLAVEISSVIDERDVERALRRSALLRRAGFRTIPVVAGERATLGAEDEARAHHVAVLQDGRVFLWAEALHAWATS